MERYYLFGVTGRVNDADDHRDQDGGDHGDDDDHDDDRPHGAPSAQPSAFLRCEFLGACIVHEQIVAPSAPDERIEHVFD